MWVAFFYLLRCSVCLLLINKMYKKIYSHAIYLGTIIFFLTLISNEQPLSSHSSPHRSPLDKTECRKCARALQELENIDDEADQLGIGFVKIHDEDLADEYNLGALPKLVYYRHQIPIIYESKWNYCALKSTFLTFSCLLRWIIARRGCSWVVDWE